MLRRWLLSATLAALAWGAAITDPSHDENSTNSTGCAEAVSAEHDELWWQESYEFLHFAEVTIVALVLVTMLVDAVEHKLEHIAEHSPEYVRAARHGRKELALHELEKKSIEPLWAVFLNRASAEFTVLGILAFMLWFSNYCGAFSWIHRIFDDQADGFRLPTSPSEYLHNIENVHMHLFMCFALYYLIVGTSLISAQRNMASWADSSKSLHEESDESHGVLDGVMEREMGAIRGVIARAKSSAHSPTDWKDEFVVMRSTFFQALEAWSGKWEFFDETLGQTIKEASKGHGGGIVAYLEPWFPFAHYLLLNYRFLLDRIVYISPATLVSMIIINGFQAIIHRTKTTFEFSFVWIIAFTIIVAVLWVATANVINKLETGTYKHGELVSDPRLKWLHSSSLPKNVCVTLQICMVYVCFELTSPLAHGDTWAIDYWRSVSHVLTSFLVMPLFGWLILGNLLARLALTLSCGFMISEENILRIQVMVEMHVASSKAKHQPTHDEEIQTDESQAHTALDLSDENLQQVNHMTTL
mmetsp:Transcript_33804/g.78162  ORF Transcript_33804/g.78162 Transcript_33804/m.78162 type:complete len:529 (-) Transcript_33804:11-1597(-)